MRAFRSIVSILLAVCLLGATVVPALAADTVKVQFQNKTGSEVTISLSGPASYSLRLPTGKTNAEVVPGRYTYSYKACDGQTFKGNFNARNAGATLNLPKCKKDNSGGGGGEIKVTVKNSTGGTLTIYLSGPATYSFSFGTGNTKISIVPGKYNYTAYGCGSSDTGTRNFKGGGSTWTFWCY
jgi:hypothetical protein